MIYKDTKCSKCETKRNIWYWFKDVREIMFYRMFCTNCGHSNLINTNTRMPSWQPLLSNYINNKVHSRKKEAIIDRIELEEALSKEESDQLIYMHKC